MVPATELGQQQEYQKLCSIVFTTICIMEELYIEKNQYRASKNTPEFFNKLFLQEQTTSQKSLILQRLFVSQIDLEFEDIDLNDRIVLITNFIERFKHNRETHVTVEADYYKFLNQKTELLDILKKNYPTRHPRIKKIIEHLVTELGTTIGIGLYSKGLLNRTLNKLHYDKEAKYDRQKMRTHAYNHNIEELERLLSILTTIEDMKKLEREEKIIIKNETNEIRKIIGNAHHTINEDNKLLIIKSTVDLIIKSANDPTTLNIIYSKILTSKLFPDRYHEYYQRKIIDLEQLFFEEYSADKYTSESVRLELITKFVNFSLARSYIKLNHADPRVLKHILENSFLDKKYFGNPDYNSYVLSLLSYGLFEEADTEIEKLSDEDKKIIFNRIANKNILIASDTLYNFSCQMRLETLNHIAKYANDMDVKVAQSVTTQLFRLIMKQSEGLDAPEKYFNGLINLIVRTKYMADIKINSIYPEYKHTVTILFKLLKYADTKNSEIKSKILPPLKEAIASKFSDIISTCNMNNPQQKLELYFTIDIIFIENPDLLKHLISSAKTNMEILEYVLNGFSKHLAYDNRENVNPYLVIAKNARHNSFELFYMAFEKRNHHIWKYYWSKIGNADSSIIIYLCLSFIKGDTQRKKEILKIVCKDNNMIKKIGTNLFYALAYQAESLDPTMLEYFKKIIPIHYNRISIKSIIADKYRLWNNNPDVFTQKHFYNLNAHDVAKAGIAKKSTRDSYIIKLIERYPNTTKLEADILAELNIYLIILKKFIDVKPEPNDPNLNLWKNLVAFCRMKDSDYTAKIQNNTIQSFKYFKEQFIKGQPDFISSILNINIFSDLKDELKYDNNLTKIISVLLDTTVDKDNEKLFGAGHYSNHKLKDFIRYCALLITEDIEAVGNSKCNWEDKIKFLQELGYTDNDAIHTSMIAAKELQGPSSGLLQFAENQIINEAAIDDYNKTLLEYQNRFIQQFVHAIESNISKSAANGGNYEVSCLSGIYTRFMKNVFEIHHASPLTNRNIAIEAILKENFERFVKSKFRIFFEQTLLDVSKFNMTLLDQYDSLFSINEETWPQIYTSGYAYLNDTATIQRFSHLIDSDVPQQVIRLKDVDRIRTELLKECFGNFSMLLNNIVEQLPTNMHYALNSAEKEYISYMIRNLFEDDKFMLELATELQPTKNASIMQSSSYFERFVKEVTKQQPDIRNLKEYLRNAILDTLIPQQRIFEDEEIISLRNLCLDNINSDNQLGNFKESINIICGDEYKVILRDMLQANKTAASSIIEFLNTFKLCHDVTLENNSVINKLLLYIVKTKKPMSAQRLTL